MSIAARAPRRRTAIENPCTRPSIVQHIMSSRRQRTSVKRLAAYMFAKRARQFVVQPRPKLELTSAGTMDIGVLAARLRHSAPAAAPKPFMASSNVGVASTTSVARAEDDEDDDEEPDLAFVEVRTRSGRTTRTARPAVVAERIVGSAARATARHLNGRATAQPAQRPQAQRAQAQV